MTFYSTSIATAVVVAFVTTTSSTTFPNVVNAFAPVSHSSFAIRPETAPNALLSNAPKTMMIPSSSSSSSTTGTALQMNLVDRFVRVAKGNLNQVLMSLEDPEKIMNQAVEDMQKDLLKIRQSYAEITASQRRLEKQKEVAESVANDWYNRAQLALKKGEERLAKAALTRRQEQLEIIKNLHAQMETQGIAMDKLYDGMLALEGKIVEAKQKKQQYAARAKAAESTTKVNDMLSGMTGKTSMDAFKRMEEKVEALEAAAEASSEMVNLFPEAASGGLLGSGDDKLSLENEFLLLEGSAAIDDELEKMKIKLLGQSSSSSKKKKNVDPEVEKLNKEYSRKISIKTLD